MSAIELSFLVYCICLLWWELYGYVYDRTMGFLTIDSTSISHLSWIWSMWMINPFIETDTNKWFVSLAKLWGSEWQNELYIHTCTCPLPNVFLVSYAIIHEMLTPIMGLVMSMDKWYVISSSYHGADVLNKGTLISWFLSFHVATYVHK